MWPPSSSCKLSANTEEPHPLSGGHSTRFQKQKRWGLALGTNSGLWVSDNGTSVSTLYNGAGVSPRPPVAIPAPGDDPVNGPFHGTPTGTVFNGTTDFVITQGGNSGPSRFLFATEDGTILGWNPEGPCDRDVAVLRFDRPDGRVQAVLVNYACHPVVIEDPRITISSPTVEVNTSPVAGS